jgi:hypothetical protein
LADKLFPKRVDFGVALALGKLEQKRGAGRGKRGEREEGTGKKEEGRGKKEDGRRGKKEDGRRGKKEEGRGLRLRVEGGWGVEDGRWRA